MSEYQVGIRDLKARLSEYLRRVKQGDVVIITEHGKPVGRIVPEEETVEGKMNRLAATGRYSWSGKKMVVHEPIAENKSGYSIAEMIIEDRE